MPTGKQSASLILSLATILLAAVAGIVIPLASGSVPQETALGWTPPPSRTATSFTRSAAVPTRTLPARWSATPQPTTPVPTVTPTMTPVVVAASPEPAATPALTVPSTPTAAAPPTSTPQPTPTATPAAPRARVLAEPVNLRAGPGTDFPPLGIARLGDVYVLQGRSADGEWYQVCCVRAAPAWINASLIATEGITDTLPVIP